MQVVSTNFPSKFYVDMGDKFGRLIAFWRDGTWYGIPNRTYGHGDLATAMGSTVGKLILDGYYRIACYKTPSSADVWITVNWPMFPKRKIVDILGDLICAKVIDECANALVVDYMLKSNWVSAKGTVAELMA